MVSNRYSFGSIFDLLGTLEAKKSQKSVPEGAWGGEKLDAEKTLKKEAEKGAQKTPETYQKASRKHLEKTSKENAVSRPKKGCKNSFAGCY